MPLLVLLDPSGQVQVPDHFSFVDVDGNPFPAGIGLRFFNGPQLYPTPVLSPNVYVDSDTLSGSTLSGLTLGTGGPGGAIDAEYPGTGAAAGANKTISQVVDVTAGQSYIPSSFIDPSHVTNLGSDVVEIGIKTADGITPLIQQFVTASAAGRYATAAWTCPAGTTQVQVVAKLLSTAIVTSGQKFKISQPMLAPSGYDPQTYLPAGVTLGAQVLTGYTQIGGTFDPATSLVSGRHYTVAFVGTQAPAITASFVYDSTQPQTIDPLYGSPVASQSGYANRQTQLWTRGWFNDPARSFGGVAYNIALGLAAELLDLSQQQQAVIMAARIDTSSGTDIESWVADFFGLNLPRFSGETNEQYIGRAKAMLQAKAGTPSGVQTVADYYGTAWINEPWQTAQTGGYATTLSTCGYGVAGGYGSQKPLIQIFVDPNAGVVGSSMKSSLLAARGCGIRTQVISVTPGVSGEGWGLGTFDVAHFGVQSQNDGVIL